MTTYALGRTAVLQCGSLHSPYYSVRDAATDESFDQYQLAAYFEAGKERFSSLLRKLYDAEERITLEDEAQLLFMLESLVHARNELKACEKA